MRVVAAPDKFRGTLSATEAADAVEQAATALGWECTRVPMADGGEGTLEVFGGPNRTSEVTDPLGDTVEAGWRLDGRRAVIEMARASGLELVGGAAGNDPVAATTFGTGELIEAALERSAERIIVGAGGSATTDGGLGALRALYPLQRLRAVELVVACDVRTPFVDAAEIFGPQKGATPAQVELLRRRLERLVDVYRTEHGVDVTGLPRSGAAGGLAGGLAAVGAELVDGFDVLAEEIDLYSSIRGADLVVTGEGFIDAQSFDGKVVGGVVELAAELSVPALAVAGQVFDRAGERVRAVSLTDRFGAERSREDTAAALAEVVAECLADHTGTR